MVTPKTTMRRESDGRARRAARSVLTVWGYAACACVVGSGIADGAAVPVRVAYSQATSDQLPLYVAQEAHLFEKQGVNATLVLVESGTTATQSLIAGDIQFMAGAPIAVVNAALAGAPVVLIAGLLNSPSYYLVTSSDILRPEDFRGKTAAITRFGSSTDISMRLTLKRLGLQPDRDVKLLQVGSAANQLASLVSGRTQLFVGSITYATQAQRQGFRVYASLADLQIPYASTAIGVSKTFAAAHEETVLRFLRAIVEAIQWQRSHPAETQQILRKYLRLEDPALLELVYQEALKIFAPMPVVQPEAVRTVLEELSQSNPAARDADPQQFIEARFLRTLDGEGMFRRGVTESSR